jgi:hypothetical protein
VHDESLLSYMVPHCRQATSPGDLMLASAQRRVHVCPVEALSAVSAEARACIPERFRSHFSALSAAGHVSTCPTEAAARLEAWLLSTRGAELRKAKSFDTALRSMAHATYVWSLDATQPAGADDLTRRPETHLRHLSLPAGPPATHGHGRGGFGGFSGSVGARVPRPYVRRPFPYLRPTAEARPRGGSAGHLIGRGGKFIKPLLERYPQVRVHFGGDTVSISGPLAADVELVAGELHARLADAKLARAKKLESELRRLRANNPALTLLFLHGHDLGAEGAAHLAGALHDNTVLKSLHLECNGLGDEGATHLAGALHVNIALEHLNLSDNGIGDAGAAQLAALLHVNTVLTKLELRNNSIGDEGAAQVAAALHVNTVLTDLDLLCNSIGDEGLLRQVEAACDANHARRDDDTGVDGAPPGTKMLVSNLGAEVTSEDLQDLFEEHGGPLKKNAVVFYNQDGSSLGQGEVVFRRRADAEKALERLNGVPLDARPLQLALVGVDGAPPGTKMLVSNLGAEVTSEDLQELFEEHGGPLEKNAVVFYNQDGSSLGQGEVVFRRRADAEKALERLNGVPLDARPLQLALVGVDGAPPGTKMLVSNLGAVTITHSPFVVLKTFHRYIT